MCVFEKWLEGQSRKILNNFPNSFFFFALHYLLVIMFLIIFVKNYIIHHCLSTKSFAILGGGIVMSLIQNILIFLSLQENYVCFFHIEYMIISILLNRVFFVHVRKSNR